MKIKDESCVSPADAKNNDRDLMRLLLTLGGGALIMIVLYREELVFWSCISGLLTWIAGGVIVWRSKALRNGVCKAEDDQQC